MLKKSQIERSHDLRVKPLGFTRQESMHMLYWKKGDVRSIYTFELEPRQLPS